VTISTTPATRACACAARYVIDAKGASHRATLAVDGCAFDANPAAPWGRRVTAPGATECTVRVTWGGTDAIEHPALVDPTWVTTGSLVTGRDTHAMTLLGDGRVLVTGGQEWNGVSVQPASTTEIFDPSSQPDGGADGLAPEGSPSRSAGTGPSCSATTPSTASTLPGETCAANADCSSGICDPDTKVCCASACSTSCMACAPGSGSCSQPFVNADDSTSCTGTKTCSASGETKCTTSTRDHPSCTDRFVNDP
jgi:hypothetical protein